MQQNCSIPKITKLRWSQNIIFSFIHQRNMVAQRKRKTNKETSLNLTRVNFNISTGISTFIQKQKPLVLLRIFWYDE